MPPKKLIGKGKDKENEKKKKKQHGVAVDASKILKEIIKEYDAKCDYYNVAVCVPIRRQLKVSMDESKLLHRFLIDPKDRRKVEYWEDEDLPTVFAPEDTLLKKKQAKVKKESLLLVKVLPLLETLRNRRYIHIQELFIWEVLIEHDDICALSGMLARSIYQFVRIEMVDCFLIPKCFTKLAPSINLCRTLQELVLDFNEFGDEGCKTLCEGLKGNRWLIQLSLCYCNLTTSSGHYLGQLIGVHPIRELFLDGNDLQAEGVILLLDLLNIGAEKEAIERLELKRLKEEQEAQLKNAENKPRYNVESSDNPTDTTQDPTQTESTPVSSKKGKKKGGGKKRKKSKKKSKTQQFVPPPAGPQINKLRIADNGIDQMGRGGNFAPMRCMQIFKTIISNSADLEEIDLFGNDIGDLGSRQLLEGLITRKMNKLPQIGLRVAHRINQDTFDLITKLAPGAKKKKGKGKGKGKKKK